jgi:hypothetical protein
MRQVDFQTILAWYKDAGIKRLTRLPTVLSS